MIGTIIQPPYLPWLGFFDRVLKSDVLVLLDVVAMDRNSRTKFLNRNKLRTKAGWTWLTVPLAKGPRDQPIREIGINDGEPWRERHWRTVELNYRRAKHFADYAASIKVNYDQTWLRLVDLNQALLDTILHGFAMAPRIALASELGAHGTGSSLLIDICRKLGVETYLSGPFGRNYIDRNAFEAAGIELLFHDYIHPRYEQAFAGFEPCMSALDLLLNHGPTGRELLESPADSLVRE